jgi:RHS repeat-associated protein
VRVSILVEAREDTSSTSKSFSFNNAGVISVGYRVNDQVASITQNGATTAYSFDGLGRRVTETTGSSVVTKHYTGSSDNPAWSTNTAGVTDIYVSSLGTGLNSTVTLDNGVKTLSLDVNDLRGNTVTRINVDTASTDSWVSFDEYGNRDAASTGKLVTYDAYGQYERATTSQGLILKGARLYNPVTNQFTSPDPITGGNETTYTYPNDPINKTDFDGNWGWGDTLDLFSFVAPIAFAIACGASLICGIAAGAALGVITSMATLAISNPKAKASDFVEVALQGAAIGGIGSVGGGSSRILLAARKFHRGARFSLKAPRAATAVAGRIWRGRTRLQRESSHVGMKTFSGKSGRNFRSGGTDEKGLAKSNFGIDGRRESLHVFLRRDW